MDSETIRENMSIHKSAQKFFTEKIDLLVKNDDDGNRIHFLFQDEFYTSKRYERFEKKIRSRIFDYLRIFTPQDFETLDTGIADYILNLLSLGGEVNTYPFRNSIAENAESRFKIAKFAENATGILVLHNWETDDYEKHNTFCSYIENELRKEIRNHVVAKIIENPAIESSNYVTQLEFLPKDYYLILSSVMQSAINYIILRQDGNYTPQAVDFYGMLQNKNNVISQTVEKIEQLQKENENLKRQLSKVSNHKEKIVERKVLIDNPELLRENKILNEENERLQSEIKELENLIIIAEDRESKQNEAFHHIRNDKILFVGGHQNEQQKLRFLFPNAEVFDKCSMNIQANYLLRFDYVVFLTHYMSHSLYHKVKGMADMQNVSYLHCSHNNITMIIDEIISHSQHKE